MIDNIIIWACRVLAVSSFAYGFFCFWYSDLSNAITFPILAISFLLNGETARQNQKIASLRNEQ